MAQSASVRGGSWVGYWLLFGLAYQLLYHGLPWPLQLQTWLHVLFWPAYVLLHLLRWAFIPFAAVAALGFIAVLLFNIRGGRDARGD